MYVHIDIQAHLEQESRALLAECSSLAADFRKKHLVLLLPYRTFLLHALQLAPQRILHQLPLGLERALHAL